MASAANVDDAGTQKAFCRIQETNFTRLLALIALQIQRKNRRKLRNIDVKRWRVFLFIWCHIVSASSQLWAFVISFPSGTRVHYIGLLSVMDAESGGAREWDSRAIKTTGIGEWRFQGQNWVTYWRISVMRLKGFHADMDGFSSVNILTTYFCCISRKQQSKISREITAVVCHQKIPANVIHDEHELNNRPLASYDRHVLLNFRNLA
jgi:hypothetical protein